MLTNFKDDVSESKSILLVIFVMYVYIHEMEMNMLIQYFCPAIFSNTCKQEFLKLSCGDYSQFCLVGVYICFFLNCILQV